MTGEERKHKSYRSIPALVGLSLVSLVIGVLIGFSQAAGVVQGTNWMLAGRPAGNDCPACGDLVNNLPAVIDTYAPLELSRPISTEEAIALFRHLYDHSYFNERLQSWDDQVRYSEYYNLSPDLEKEADVHRIAELTEAFEPVDRRAFLEAVAYHISPNHSVDELEDFVRDAMAQPIGDLTWHDPARTKFVKDPVILLFSGLGQCGQTNRLLVDLLQFGAGFEARVIGTPGHGFAEVRDGSGWRILDADIPISGVRLPKVSYEEYVENYPLYSVLMDTIDVRPRYPLALSTAYQADVPLEEGWYTYYTRIIDEDVKGFQSISDKRSENFSYHTEGHIRLDGKYHLENEKRQVWVELPEWPYERTRSISLLVLTDDATGLFNLQGEELAQAISRQEFLSYLIHEHFQVVGDATEISIELPQDIPEGHYWLMLLVYPGNSNRLRAFFVNAWETDIP